MNKVSINKVGLVFGGAFAICHAVWSLLVLASLAKPFLDFILGLHFLSFDYSVDSFSFGTAGLLVVVTAVIGYVVGCVVGWLWNLGHK